MAPWRNLILTLSALLALFANPGRALPAPNGNEIAGIRDALANAEKQHQETYAASKFAEAIEAARAGLALAERGGTLADKVMFTRHLAYDNFLMGDNESAIEYSQRLLEFAEALNDNRIRAQAHRYLSQIYETLEDDARCRSHAERSLAFAKLAGDEDIRIYALTAIGVSDARAGRFDAAIRAFDESRAHWLNKKRPWNAINSLVNLADVAIARNDLSGALNRYEEIFTERVANKDQSGQVRAMAAIGNLLRRLGRAPEALPRLLAARPLAEAIGSHRVLAEFYGSLAQVQEACRDFAAALATERLVADEREKLGSERARLRATELEARLDLAQKQQAIDQLRSVIAVNEAKVRMANADLAQVRAFNIAVLDGALALGAIGVAAWLVRRYRLRHRRLVNAITAATGSRPPFE
jgi:tetratricopeptide (TPR) repeat protein